MATISKPVCRYCRRYAEKLYLKGLRCESAKCPVDPRVKKKAFGPAKTSEYGMQLREKNKAKIFYGILERQFRKYFEVAKKSKGVTGEILLQSFERRLDNVVYRLKWTPSRRMAKQEVGHGHVFVNGKKVDRPSYQVEIGDEITIKENSTFKTRAEATLEARKSHPLAAWLETNDTGLKAHIVRFPKRDEVPLLINEQLIINYYSK